MNTFSLQTLYPAACYSPREETQDWLDMDWGGPYPEDDPVEIVLPIYGPLNKDGISLGYIVITE